MAGQKISSDLLCPYALGSLDKSDEMEFNELLNSDADFPWQELGEYQNLAALLPAILNIETPKPALKDKVARKLYRIKNERRSGKFYDKTTNESLPDKPGQAGVPNEVKNKPLVDNTESLSNVFQQAKPAGNKGGAGSGYNREFEMEPSKDRDEYEEVHPKDITREDSGYSQYSQAPKKDQKENLSSKNKKAENKPDEKIKPATAEEIDTFGLDSENMFSRERNEHVPASEKKSYQLHGINDDDEKKTSRPAYSQRDGRTSRVVLILLILFIILAATAAVYVYFKISDEVSHYKSEVDKLNSQINSINEQMGSNREIQKILQSKNVYIVNLSGTSISKDSFGKLIISFDNSAGYLQISNMQLAAGKSYYELWVILKDIPVSLGVFAPAGDKSYFPFAIPELNNKGETKFLVTEESSGESAKPSNQVYLTGTLR